MSLKTKLGLGTVQFGTSYGISNTSGQTSSEEITKILHFAKTNDILLIDTASSYGMSEEALGKNDLTGFNIVSKFMPPEDGESINDQLLKSLSKLNVKSLYGYLAHRPTHIFENPDQWNELNSLKKKGLVEKIGFSLNKPSELEDLLGLGLVPDLVQVPFNYFDRRFTTLLEKLKKKGCEVHTRSAFLQGLFFTKTDRLNAFFDEVKPIILTLQQTVSHLPGALLSFVAAQPFIDKVIIGVENCIQLAENYNSLDSIYILPEFKIPLPENILMPSQWPKA